MAFTFFSVGKKHEYFVRQVVHSHAHPVPCHVWLLWYSHSRTVLARNHTAHGASNIYLVAIYRKTCHSLLKGILHHGDAKERRTESWRVGS